MAFICYECHKKTACKWPFHVPPKTPISTATYDGVVVEVYAAITSNVSFGRCEDCEKTRPCVDC